MKMKLLILVPAVKLIRAIGVLGMVCFSFPAASATILGTGTLNVTDDLTRIDAGSFILEFLDLPFTRNTSVASALSTYETDGFTWATGSQVSELYNAFGFPHPISGSGVFDLAASPSSRANYLSFLGETIPNATLGWIDYNTGSQHTHDCISVEGRCAPDAHTITRASLWPTHEFIGVYLVRATPAPPIPEPTTIAIFTLGLLGLGAARRRRKAANMGGVGTLVFGRTGA
jgi:hypothetical protein